MVAFAIPIRRIEAASQFGASLHRYQMRPPLLRRLIMFWQFPKILKLINDTLSGEGAGKLTKEQATELYRAIEPLHRALENSILEFGKRSIFERVLFGWRVQRLETQTQVLGDILETLAWGCDPDLRGYIDRSVNSLDCGSSLCQRS
jgi:hypothetical protein